MPYIDPPSFSLGLDLDARSEPRIPDPPDTSPTFTLLHDDASAEEEEDDDLRGLEVMDSEEEEGEGAGSGGRVVDPVSAPTRILKRLSRGPAMGDSSRARKERVLCENEDDEIEDFSPSSSQSQHDFLRDPHPSNAVHNSVCSSSKVPLRGSGVLTPQSSTQRNGKGNEWASDAPASSGLGMGQSGLIFPKLTISPLRKFQLVDSDSDEAVIARDVSRDAEKINSSAKQQGSTSGSGQKRKMSVEKHQSEDLWEDFCPIKSFSFSTPVLDEMCNEYFQSRRNKSAGSDFCNTANVGRHQDENGITGFEQCWNSANSLPPAHRYFFHDDPRIRKLVRSRLPYISPLAMVNSRENQQPNGSDLDYMCQFNGQASQQARTHGNNVKKGSTKGRNKPKKANGKEVADASQGWVDPKSSTTPKDAGRRRFHANGQAVGHWFTSPEGRKVYVSKSGQEFSGQIAYRHYRKESGGFRKSKKKTNVKRKKG